MEKCYLYIVLTRINTAISKLIKIFKNDVITHSVISLDKEINRMYIFGRWTHRILLLDGLEMRI